MLKLVANLQSYDIGFTVHYIGEGSKEVVEMQRHEAFKRVRRNLVLLLIFQVITGSFEVEQSGQYKFVWDNTFSWTRGKSVKFNVYKGTEVLQ